jgi:uncharacterized membrane protein YeaQ/YmgE (transglycosylase-associated protein family)
MGLVAGVIAKLIMPGRDPGGIILTVLLGIGGAVGGGMLGTALGYGTVNGFDLRSLAISVGGALAILLVYRIFVPRLSL